MKYRQGITLVKRPAANPAQEGAARLLRAAAQISGLPPCRDTQVRRYNLLKAMHMYRQRFGRGVMDGEI